MECDGQNCDKKRFVVLKDTSDLVVEARTVTVPEVVATQSNPGFFSDSSNFIGVTQAECPSDMVVNEIECSGTQCDDMKLDCGTVAASARSVVSDVKEDIGPFSDQDPSGVCADNYDLSGVMETSAPRSS